MKRLTLWILCLLSLSMLASAQAREIPSAQSSATGDVEQRGRALLDQMVQALGGDAWLNRRDMESSGRTATFFHNQPNEWVIYFDSWHRFSASGQPEAERVGFLTDRALNMFVPSGKKIDVVQIWTPTAGYEVTYKGRVALPKDQVADAIRRRNHSVEAVVHTWLKTPGVMIISEGQSMVMRRVADKVTLLLPTNDAVTLELDAATHLPMRRTFEWRNEQFKDHDEDVEEYDDYHTVQGLPTAFITTRYRNGDMVNQRFLTSVQYNQEVAGDMFDPDHVVLKKK
ncbi:MAG: hypothetical protein FWD64_04595 [Acidobacteriaceae bacterium]|nr:hypothetical protein [Acidobacteriaceae bacterium]